MKTTKQRISIIGLVLISTTLNAQTNIFESGDKVGIGITSPAQKLDVNGNANLRGNLLMNDNAVYLTSGGDYLVGVGASGSGTFHTRGQLILSSNGNDIGASLLLKNNNLTAMAIAPGGRVGIGTTTPTATLQIDKTGTTALSKSDIFLQIGSTGNAGQYQAIGFGYSGETYVPAVIAYKTTIGSGSSRGELGFYTRPVGENIEPTQRLVITSSGYVGINTPSPTEQLSVNGNIKTKKIIVVQSDWPDYVFHPSYKMKPLSEIAQFIKKNKHLPDVPSAKEVQENGVSLGDNQALLLKKIEELTLYIIDIKQQMEQQQNQIKQLQKERK